MSIDAKGIPVLIWKFLRFSMLNVFKFVQKYPIPSGVIFVFFLLYLFLPSLFSILIFTSPILVAAWVIIRFRLNSKRRHDFGKKNDADQRSSNPNPNPSFRREKSVRRNVRKENSELDSEGNIITLTNPLDEILGRNKEKHTLLKERKGKSISTLDNEESVSISDNHLVSDSEQSESSSMRGRGRFFGEVESMEDADDEDEEGLQERNKAVEWTEDDQKNLMDLGVSELERNKRLESLIARRRARKLFRMAVEKSLMDMDSCVPPGQIAPIFVAKGNQSNDFKAPEQMPGSAPSILLPGRNPFDLPYDPQEEKPNLTGDDFQHEFLDAHQKDMFFSRHESFCRGPFFSIEAKHDPQLGFCFGAKQKAVERPNLPTFVKQSDKGGCEQQPVPVENATDLIQLDDSEEVPRVEQRMNEQNLIETGVKNEVPFQEETTSANETEVQTEIDTMDEKCSSSSPSSSETDEGILDRKRFPEVLTYHVRKTLLQGTPPKSPSVDKPPLIAIVSPTTTEHDKARLTDHHTFFMAPLHTPSNSIASDLQVEVSEGGSPRHGVDEDLIHYDADTDRGISSDNDEKWDCSFQERRDEKGTNSVATSLSTETRDIDHGFSEGMEATTEADEGSRTANISIKSSPEVDIEKPEESTKPSGGVLEVKPNEDTDRARILIKKEPLSDLGTPNETIKSKSCQYIPVNAGWSYDQSIMAYEKIVEMNQGFKASNITEEVQGENMSVLIQDSGDDDQDEPRVVASAIPSRLGIEHDSGTCNSFASPRTVIQPEVPKDQNAQQIFVNSVDHSPENSSVGKLEEQSDMEKKSTEESNGTTSQINELHVEQVEGTKDFSIKSTVKDSEAVSVNHKDAEAKAENLTKHDANDSNPSKSEKENANLNVADTTLKKEEEDNNATPSKPTGESNLQSTEAKAENPTKHDANDSPSNSEIENANSSVTETAFNKDQNAERILDNPVNILPTNSSIVKLEEHQNMTGNFVKESNNTSSQMNEPHLEHKEGTKDSLIDNRVAEELPQPAEESNLQSVTHTEAKAENLTKHDANDSPSKSEKENAKSNVADTTPKKEEEGSNATPSKPTEESNLQSVKHIEAKSKNPTKHDANDSNPSKLERENAKASVADTTPKKEEEDSNATPSKLNGGSDSSSGMKIIEELKELISEEGTKDTPKHDEKVIENSRDDQPLESVKYETKDVEKETKDGHVVAG